MSEDTAKTRLGTHQIDLLLPARLSGSEMRNTREIQTLCLRLPMLHQPSVGLPNLL